MVVRSLMLLIFQVFFVWNAFGAEVVTWKGEFTQGGLLIGSLEKGAVSEVHALDRKIDITPQGKFAIGLGRDFSKTLEVTFVLNDGSRIVEAYPILKRDYKIQRVEGVPQRTVTPDPEHLKRIRKESALVKKSRANTSRLTYYLEDFIWPAKGIISGVYGSQRFYNGKPGRPHFGLDIASPKGTPVIAPSSGVSVLAETDLFYSGGTIILDHGDGVSSSFLHMSKVTVAVGDKISRGDLMGEIGSTGRATGAHLDWRMNWFDQRIDPRLLMKDQQPPR